MKRRKWKATDKKILIDNYATKTIKELMLLLDGRSEESINNKIKQLKAMGKITGGKDESTIRRAYLQRSR